MAHTYTPGLAVTSWSVTTKKRILPIPGEVLVTPGQQVASDTVVARAELPGKVHVINVVNQLGILPEDLKEFMVKGEGDSVEKGEVLAENKPLIKWFKSSVTSPIAGTFFVRGRQQPPPFDIRNRTQFRLSRSVR